MALVSAARLPLPVMCRKIHASSYADHARAVERLLARSAAPALRRQRHELAGTVRRRGAIADDARRRRKPRKWPKTATSAVNNGVAMGVTNRKARAGGAFWGLTLRGWGVAVNAPYGECSAGGGRGNRTSGHSMRLGGPIADE